jgi:hypothetical protein
MKRSRRDHCCTNASVYTFRCSEELERCSFKVVFEPDGEGDLAISTLRLAHNHALLKHSNEEKRKAHNEREKLRETLQKKAEEEHRRLKTSEDFRAGFEDDEAPSIPARIEQALLVWSLKSSRVLGNDGARNWEAEMRVKGLFVSDYPVRPSAVPYILAARLHVLPFPQSDSALDHPRPSSTVFSCASSSRAPPRSKPLPSQPGEGRVLRHIRSTPSPRSQSAIVDETAGSDGSNDDSAEQTQDESEDDRTRADTRRTQKPREESMQRRGKKIYQRLQPKQSKGKRRMIVSQGEQRNKVRVPPSSLFSKLTVFSPCSSPHSSPSLLANNPFPLPASPHKKSFSFPLLNRKRP